MRKIIILVCMLLLLTMAFKKKVTTLAYCLKLKESKIGICLKKVATENTAKLQYELSDRYYRIGEYEQAVNLLTNAAKQGYTKAQFALAHLYEKGRFVVQDNQKAVYWAVKASKKGKAEIQYELANEYYRREDYKQRVDLLTKSANQGYVKAQVDLGRIYENGKGVVKNNIKAYAWFSVAVHNGQSDTFLKHIEKEMSPDDIKQAQDLAQELLKTIKK